MRHTFLAIVPLVLLGACADQTASPLAEANTPPAHVSLGPIIHRVTAGGPDMCVSLGFHPGCDGNYSLVAMERADGSVTGEWSDQDGSPEGIHARVDCLTVVPIGFRPGLQAWIGGVVDRPLIAAGHRIITRVRDNGTTANDRSDVIGRSIIDPQDEGLSPDCHDMPAFGFGLMPQGQVSIW